MTAIDVCGQDIRIEGQMVRIAHIDGDKYTAPHDLDALLEGLKSIPRRVDLFTFMQHPPDTQPRYPYPFEWDNLAVMPVTTFDHWWNHQIKSVGRNRARQAEKKGLVISEVPFDDALLHGIVEIHNETPIRQGRKFPHYGMDLGGARRYAGTFLDRSIFIAAKEQERIVGFLKLCVSETGRHACAINILAMLRHRDKAPTNGMIARAVKSCAERGIAYLVYENFAYGRKKTDSLTQFKEVNGFRQMDLPRYYIPISAVGRVALQFGLHRRLLDYFPEALLAKTREIRTAYYSRKSMAPLEGNSKD